MDYIAGIKKLREDYKYLLDIESKHKQETLDQVRLRETNLNREYKQRLESMRNLFTSLPVVKPRPITIPSIFDRTTDENFLVITWPIF